MSERREYFRIPILARVALRVLLQEEEEAARQRVRERHVPPVIPAGSFDESAMHAEQRILFELLKHMTFTLDRIDRRLEDLTRRHDPAAPPYTFPPRSLEITLSGSGFAGAFGPSLELETLVEAQLEFWNAGIPLIPTLARVVSVFESKGGLTTAFRFEELLPDDQQRIVQLTIRSQLSTIRDGRREEVA